MKFRTIAVAVALVGVLSGCAKNYAAREVGQGAAPAMMVVLNAPREARVIVDGRDVGTASQIIAGVPLSLGRHDVRIETGGQRLHAQAIFVSAGARVEVRVP